MVRTAFEHQLERLDDALQQLGEQAEQMFNMAAEMVETGEMPDGQQLYALLNDAGLYQREIDMQGMRILLRQQPVAVDLRTTTGAVRVSNDLKRIVDQSFELCQCLNDLGEQDEQMRLNALHDMTQCAKKMVMMAIDSYLESDVEEAELAAHMDDTMDEGFLHAQRLLIDALRNDTIEPSHGVSLLMAAKYLERIADHAERVTKHTIFVVKGVELS